MSISVSDVKNDNILTTKIIILLLIGLFSVIFGCLPIFFDRILSVKDCCKKIKNKDTNLDNTKSDKDSKAVNQKLKSHKKFHQLIKFLLCFGGGVLFFTSFIHLHPEIREIFKTLEKRQIFNNTISGLGGIQTSELLICCGFFLVYILEELMHYLVAVSEMRNHYEFVLHRAITKCNSMIFWRRNRTNADDNEGSRKKFKSEMNERDDVLDTFECHFGIDPEIITMDEFVSNNYNYQNNKRRDSLPMECPLSSMSSSIYGEQSQNATSTNPQSMSVICLRTHEYTHPLAASSTTFLMESITPPYINIEHNNANCSSHQNTISVSEARATKPYKSVSFPADKNLISVHESSRPSDVSPSLNNETDKFQFQFNDNKKDNSYSTKTNFHTILRGLIAIFALSIHSLFEGLAVGLEENISSIWYLFLAIGTHKFVIIFCVGIELVAAELRPLWIFIYIIGFASVTPLGILIGALITNSYEEGTIIAHQNGVTSNGVLLTVAAMLQALSAGTLLYVIFFEILIKERHHHHHFEANDDKKSGMLSHLHHTAESLIQCFAVGCGFMFMVGMHVLISNDGHPHSHAYTSNHAFGNR